MLVSASKLTPSTYHESIAVVEHFGACYTLLPSALVDNWVASYIGWRRVTVR